MVDDLAFHTHLFGEHVWGGDMEGQRTRVMPKMFARLEGRASMLQEHWPLLFQGFSHQCLRHFVLESQLLTGVPIKSEVKKNKFTRFQLVTPVLTECSGEGGRGGQAANSLCADTWQALFPGSHIYETQLLNSRTQALALEIANFCNDKARVFWPSLVTLKLMPFSPH